MGRIIVTVIMRRIFWQSHHADCDVWLWRECFRLPMWFYTCMYTLCPTRAISSTHAELQKTQQKHVSFFESWPLWPNTRASSLFVTFPQPHTSTHTRSHSREHSRDQRRSRRRSRERSRRGDDNTCIPPTRVSYWVWWWHACTLTTYLICAFVTRVWYLARLVMVSSNLSTEYYVHT